MDETKALFLQIAESIEDSIIDGTLAEEEQAPSTNELAAFHHINPATAAKGISRLVDKGVLYKRRGIGMFVATGAAQSLRAERSATFARSYIDPLLAEARKLGLDPHDLIQMIQDRAEERPAHHPEGDTP